MLFDFPESRSLTPGDVQRLLTPHRGLHGIGDHCDAVGQYHDVRDSVDGSRRAVVDLHGSLALDGRAQNRRMDHPWHLGVDTELRRSIGFRRNVDPSDIRPEIAEFTGRLERALIDLGQGLRDFREGGNFAVAQAATGLPGA